MHNKAVHNNSVSKCCPPDVSVPGGVLVAEGIRVPEDIRIPESIRVPEHFRVPEIFAIEITRPDPKKCSTRTPILIGYLDWHYRFNFSQEKTRNLFLPYFQYPPRFITVQQKILGKICN